jgi:hypothetical protein
LEEEIHSTRQTRQSTKNEASAKLNDVKKVAGKAVAKVQAKGKKIVEEVVNFVPVKNDPVPKKDNKKSTAAA